MAFNEKQLEIVNHIEGPLLCIAGPGSGKTTSIIGRVHNMVKSGINPGNILVVTFTKAAADEMKERYLRMPDAVEGVIFSTIHAICFRILRKHMPDRLTKDAVLQEFDQRNFFKEKTKYLHLERSDQDAIVSTLIGAISQIKNNDISPYSIELEGCTNEEFVAIYQDYENFKKEENKIDFDDMICMVDNLFASHKDILDAWRRKFKYLIIDEFQDTNILQSKILYNLAYPENNICIVGDDDQCIYRFRGAVPQIMLDFEKQFSGCKKVILDTNYRSEKEIVAATKRLIEHNKVRFGKSLNAFKTGDGQISYTQFKNRDKELGVILKDIKNRQRKGEALEEIAILYRNNAQAQQIASLCTKMEIPFYTNEPVYHIYEHWIFRDILNFKKVADNKCNVFEFLSVINRPNKYVSRKILPTEYSEEGVMKSVFKISEPWKRKKMQDAFDDFYYWMEKMSEMTPSDFISSMRKKLKYDDFIKDYAESNRLDISQFTDVLDEIEETSKVFTTFPEWLDFTKKELEEFKEKIRGKTKEGSISLSTMHKAKGLEWDVVFIVDANEEITPYYKATTEEDIEDERRMFYVATTRARKELNICYFEKRNKTPMYPSRFIKDMQPPVLVKEVEEKQNPLGLAKKEDILPVSVLVPQTWVFHKTFGSGVIIRNDNGKLTISFTTAGMKTLSLEWCQQNLEIFK